MSRIKFRRGLAPKSSYLRKVQVRTIAKRIEAIRDSSSPNFEYALLGVSYLESVICSAEACIPQGHQRTKIAPFTLLERKIREISEKQLTSSQLTLLIQLCRALMKRLRVQRGTKVNDRRKRLSRTESLLSNLERIRKQREKEQIGRDFVPIWNAALEARNFDMLREGLLNSVSDMRNEYLRLEAIYFLSSNAENLVPPDRVQEALNWIARFPPDERTDEELMPCIALIAVVVRVLYPEGQEKSRPIGACPISDFARDLIKALIGGRNSTEELDNLLRAALEYVGWGED